MERQLEKLQRELLDRDRFILVPKTLKDSPIPMKRMQKHDEEDNPINEYYTLQDLADAFGNQYTLEEYVTPDFIIVGWCSYANGEELAIKSFLKAIGLVDIRDDLTEFGLNVEDIEWTAIQPNSFGIFSRNELRYIPKAVAQEEVIV